MSIAETSTLMIITDQAVKIRHLEKENKILWENIQGLEENIRSLVRDYKITLADHRETLLELDRLRNKL